MSDKQVVEAKNIIAVILAAGESSRFGSPKQLADWHGKPLLQHVFDTVSQVFPKTWVMLGANYKEINSVLSFGVAKVLHESAWQEGMGKVIASAASSAESEALLTDENVDGLLFLLGDQPLIETSDLRKYCTLVNEQANEIICAGYQEEDKELSLGVPAYFPWSYLPQLKGLAVPGNQGGAKGIILRNKTTPAYLGGRVQDVDTESDLERLRLAVTSVC